MHGSRKCQTKEQPTKFSSANCSRVASASHTIPRLQEELQTQMLEIQSPAKGLQSFTLDFST